MLRLNFQCNVTNVWPAPLRKTVAKQLLWDQPPKCSHSNRDGAFFSLLYLLHTFTSLFRNWIIPWRRISIFVTYLLCNRIVPWGRAYSLKRLPHFLPWLNHKVWIETNEVFHSTLYHFGYRSINKCFRRLWQSKVNLYNLPQHIWYFSNCNVPYYICYITRRIC